MRGACPSHAPTITQPSAYWIDFSFYLYTLLLSSLSTSLLAQDLRDRESEERNNSSSSMTLQAPAGLTSTTRVTPSPLSPPQGGQLGLRRPTDRFALRSAFCSPSVQLLLPLLPATATAPRFSMRVISKQAYICRDCGYIYNERTPFEKSPDNYFCPVCGAPKRRFRAYQPAVAKNANDTDVRKARKAQIKRDEAIGQALPIAIVLGAAGLAGLYFYLNSTF